MATPFEVRIKQITDDYRLRMNEAPRAVGSEGLDLLVISSPVLTGRFRGNWRAAINRVNLTTNKGTRAARTVTGQPPTDTELAVPRKVIGRLKLGQTLFLTNNLPYAKRLEDGYSPKAQGPGAVLRRSFAILLARVPKIIDRVRQRGEARI